MKELELKFADSRKNHESIQEVVDKHKETVKEYKKQCEEAVSIHFAIKVQKVCSEQHRNKESKIII